MTGLCDSLRRKEHKARGTTTRQTARRIALRVTTAPDTANDVQHDDHDDESEESTQQERSVASGEKEVAEDRTGENEQRPLDVIREGPLHYRRPLFPFPAHDLSTVRQR